MQSSLELQIQTLPDNPGVYQYFDKDDNEINKDIARQYVEQSQLFIEASHSCYANISTEEQ